MLDGLIDGVPDGVLDGVPGETPGGGLNALRDALRDDLLDGPAGLVADAAPVRDGRVRGELEGARMEGVPARPPSKEVFATPLVPHLSAPSGPPVATLITDPRPATTSTAAIGRGIRRRRRRPRVSAGPAATGEAT